jgi:iron complex transport system permease protein
VLIRELGQAGAVERTRRRSELAEQDRRVPPSADVAGIADGAVNDTLARTMASIETPPGVLTALIGTPLFLWLLAVTHSRGRQA